MPRLPVILATEGVEVAPRPRVPPNIAGPGLQVAGAQLIGAVDDYTRLEAAKKKVAVDQEAALLHADAELQLGARDADLRLTERDPDAYRQQYGELVREVTQNVQKQAKYPESVAVLNAKLAPTLARHQVEAFKHSNSLYVDRGVAQLDATLDSRKTLAGIAVDDQDFQTQYKEGEAAIAAATPLIGANKAGDTRRKFREDVLGARALREANEQPETFATSADVRYAMLDPKHREQLKETARTKAESNRKNEVAEWDKFYTRVEAEAEEERKSQVVGLEQAGLKGQLTVSRLDDARAMRIVSTREEYATLYKLATEHKDAPSDRAALEDASIRAHRAEPTISPEQLDGLYRSGKLNRTDWKELKDKVIARADHLKSEGLTEAGKRQAQAEQILFKAVGITSLTDKIDDQDKQLIDIGLRELTARSNAFNGKGEDPLAVATEIANRFAPIRQERLKLKVPEIGRTLMFPAQDAATAMANLNAKRATLPPSVVAQEERKIADMTRAEGALFESDTKKRQAGDKTGGTLGRKSGDKPKTGTAD